MIPVRLTFQGIYSYQKEQTIDFSRLTNAGLFGIFGHVGSGKSTILEAMSFALFNKTDRLSGDRRNYNMMNLKSDKLYMDFEFMANDGRMYRIEVTGRRNRKNFSEVPTFKRSFYTLQGNEWVPRVETTAESVTGLSYENFHRTIIIPQGRFQEFLQLNVKDRVTMLKELFGLNKYDLYDKTIVLERQNNEQIQNLEGQLTQIGEIKPGDIEFLKLQIAETQKSLDSLGEEQKKILIRDKRLEDLKKLSADVLKQKEKVTGLLSAEPKISKIEKEVSEYEILYLAFQPELAQIKVIESSLKSLSDDLAAKKMNYDRSLNESLSMQKEIEVLKPLYDNREDLLKQAGELVKMKQILNLEETVEAIKAEVQKKKDDLNNLVINISTGKGILKQSIEQLAIKKKNLPDLKLLSEIKNWFREDKNLKDQISKDENTTAREKEKLVSCREEAFRISVSLITINGSSDSFDPCTSMAEIENAHAIAENNLKNLRPEISELEIQEQLEVFAGELQNGKPCPLCGSKDHPHILDVHDISGKLELARKRWAALDAEIRKFTKCERDLGGLLKEISLTENQVKTNQKSIDALLKKREEHLKKFIWEEFRPDHEQTVAEGIRLYDVLSKEIADLESEIDLLNKSISGKETLRDESASKIRESDTKITEHITAINLLEGQLTIVKKADWPGHLLNEIETKSVSLKSEYQLLTEKYKKLEDKMKEKHSYTCTLKGIIESTTKLVEATIEQKEQLSKRIEGKLIHHGKITLGYVEEVINKELDLNGVKKKIASFRAELDSGMNQLLILETDLGGRVYPEQEHIAIKDQLTKLQVRTDEGNQKIGTFKNTLEILGKKLVAFEKLKKDLYTLKLRNDNLSTLKNLFRGAAFVNFASRVYLENIVLAANARFKKLTRQHLELFLDEDNNFMIRDHMNEGRLRSVKTLSGGQIFQASLSLALALADNVNRQVKADQNFFFLDEGFGSLDKECLGVVFETLKALRKENRIVGVISHVEEMQQEIDAHLVVSIDDTEGSQISGSLY